MRVDTLLDIGELGIKLLGDIGEVALLAKRLIQLLAVDKDDINLIVLNRRIGLDRDVNVVEGGDDLRLLELIGSRPMRIFKRGKEAYEVQPGDDLSFLQ